MQVKEISGNEIYLLIKYIKGVLWRASKCLSYIEEARCLKVNYKRPVCVILLSLILPNLFPVNMFRFDLTA